MKHLRTIITILALCAAGAAVARAQGNAAEAKAIRDAMEGYAAAFGRGEAARGGPAFTSDAEYVTGDGTRLKGRDAIVQRLRDYLAKNPGDKLKLTADAILFVTPEIAQVDGSAELRGPNGPPDVSPYTAIMVKREGRWQIRSLRDLSPANPAAEVSTAERLSELDWMVGEWTQSAEGGVVRATCRWGPGKTFLLWDYTVRQGNSELMTVNQRVGWDPQAGQFRSWVFDSIGGFAEGRWDAADAGAWVIRQAGVLPDGGTASATCLLVPVDRNSFRWRMTERRVDGQRLGDVELRFSRAGGG